MTSSVLSMVLRFFDGEEESGQPLYEPTYAGVTAKWLRMAITERSRFALMDGFKRHKAAVKIQALFRGYQQRKINAQNNIHARNIQRTWRGYYGRQRYYRILETVLKRNIERSYNNAATLIQKQYRGFHSRKYIHDHIALEKFRLAATEELLYCVAVKTRDYLKNYELPGIYTLRNSKCLSKVEKLITLIRLKKFNENVRIARTEEISKLKRAFDKLERSKERTEVPYGGCSLRPLERHSMFKFSLREGRASRDEGFGIRNHSSDLSYTLYKRRSTKE